MPEHNSRQNQARLLLPSSFTLERMVMAHVLVLLIATTWAYGGNIGWARTMVALWGSLSIILLGLLVKETQREHSVLPKVLFNLWPLIVFNLLVLISLNFPGFRVGYYGDEALLIRNDVASYLPSSAQPIVSLHTLWVFDAIYLSCFNLLLGIKTRHSFRLFLFILSINATVLAVFGTLQKLSHASGLYFGLQPSPQPKFFSTFIYHNHWGAFTTIMVALGLGIFFHYLRRKEGQDLLRSPAIMVATSVIFLALSVPLSGSRSSTIMVLGLLLCAFMNWVYVMTGKRNRSGKKSWGSVIAASVLLFILAIVAYRIGEPVIRERILETKDQITGFNSLDDFGSRPVLYRDTWTMAKERLLFGWGMGSYPIVFQIYNTSSISPVDGLPQYFHDAHSDWLQSIAEVGLIGTALLGLCALIPFWHFRDTLFRSSISNYLLGGCAIILLYAWLEFPFGNTAVVITFWTALFTSLKYGQAESKNAGDSSFHSR